MINNVVPVVARRGRRACCHHDDGPSVSETASFGNGNDSLRQCLSESFNDSYFGSKFLYAKFAVSAALAASTIVLLRNQLPVGKQRRRIFILNNLDGIHD